MRNQRKDRNQRAGERILHFLVSVDIDVLRTVIPHHPVYQDEGPKYNALCFEATVTKRKFLTSQPKVDSIVNASTIECMHLGLDTDYA